MVSYYESPAEQKRRRQDGKRRIAGEGGAAGFPGIWLFHRHRVEWSEMADAIEEVYSGGRIGWECTV